MPTRKFSLHINYSGCDYTFCGRRLSRLFLWCLKIVQKDRSIDPLPLLKRGEKESMVVNFSIKKEKDKEPNRIRNKRGREVVFHQKGSAFVLKPPCVFYLIFRNCWERGRPRVRLMASLSFHRTGRRRPSKTWSKTTNEG